MTFSSLMAEGTTLGLLVKVIGYTTVYAVIVCLPLRGLIAVIARCQAISRKRKEARRRKPRVVRSYAR